MSSVLPLRNGSHSGSTRVARYFAAASLVTVHLAAFGLMVWTEIGALSQIAFVLTWALLNFGWLLLLRRPALSAAASLVMLSVLVLLSQFKHEVFNTTANFVDLMLIDGDTFSFLLATFPGLGATIGIALLFVVPALVLIAWLDHFRLRRRAALVGCAASLAALTGLSLAVPVDHDEQYNYENYVSKFARLGVIAITDLLTHGVYESDAAVAERLKPEQDDRCQPVGRAPHIILVLDESSFDLSRVPGIKVPGDYRRHFHSFDGKARSLLVEGSGGPSWFAEYNVLSGLSVHSYGRFAESVTRLAANRVERGLPLALGRCGYRTFSLYPWKGNFLGARGFQTTSGIEHFLDTKFLGTMEFKPDIFYFDAAFGVIERERRNGPVFVFVYTMANHFPWNFRFRPDLLPEWKESGNAAEIDEYLRRQALSERDYAELRARLARQFPDDAFLLVRFGDHQPAFAKQIVDPTADEAAIAQRIAKFDPRYLTTYYAIDAINFRPVDVSSALDPLDAPFLPLVVLEAAGLPLDPSFAEQKNILERCRGLFYRCANGAEARRFNRLLIDAGLIKGL